LAAAIDLVETQDSPLSLRGVAREVGVAATSVYLHFPDLDHLLAAVVEVGFSRLSAATAAAAATTDDPAEELKARCRAYCAYALDHPRMYRLLFQARLPRTGRSQKTPGLRAFDNLAAAVRRCLESSAAPAHDDPVRLASLIWTGMHGLVLARMARPTFPWAPVDVFVDEMVTRLMAFPVS
jgi:AcrR family transcriptional regulator